jgi:hypothetical protein
MDRRKARQSRGASLQEVYDAVWVGFAPVSMKQVSRLTGFNCGSYLHGLLRELVVEGELLCYSIPTHRDLPTHLYEVNPHVGDPDAMHRHIDAQMKNMGYTHYWYLDGVVAAVEQ